MESEYRKLKLAGDGNFGSRGGGLPLSWAFETVLQELLDHGPSPEDGLLDAIRRGRLGMKEKAVLARWGERNGWERFTRDILDELAERKLIISDEQRELYTLGPEFTAGARVEVFGKMFVTVRDEKTRIARDGLAQMHQRMFELIALGDRLGVHDGPLGEARKKSLLAAAQLYEWVSPERADPTVSPEAMRESPMVTLAQIRPGLAGYLPDRAVKPQAKKRDSAAIEKVLGPKPSPRELLELYLAGPNARRGAKLFDNNNQRLCERPITHPPEKMLDPEDFEVYPSREQGWYFQGQCRACRLQAMRDQRRRKQQNNEWNELANRLRDNPGDTAILKEFSRDDQMEAMKMARDVRSGKLSPAFAPAGTFGAVTDVRDMKVVVRAFLNS